MSEPSPTYHKLLQEEQEAINALSDTTEIALRGNCLKLKIASLNGEAGASGELTKALKNLDEYLAGQATVEWFKNSSLAGEWLASQGYLKKRGGGQLTVEAARKFVDTLRKDPAKGYNKQLIKRAADKEYGNPLRPAKETDLPQSTDGTSIGEQLQAAILRKNIADAQKKEIEIENLKREQNSRWLYRDEAAEWLAAIWATVQQSLDHAAHTASEAIALVAGGDVTRSNEIEDAIQELIIAKAFNEVADSGKIHVIFKGEQQE